MIYYDVLVATKNQLPAPLTYLSEVQLHPYQLVQVDLNQQRRLGLVLEATRSHLPKSLRRKCQPIKAVSDYILPAPFVQAVQRLAQLFPLNASELAQLMLSNATMKPLKIAAQSAVQPPAKLQPALTVAQKKIYAQMTAQPAVKPQLVVGVNGSGKTRLYAELINQQVRAGRSALVLVPAIGLSRAIFDLLQTYLPYPIAHFHSQLTAKERRHLWQKCLTSEQPVVVVGARSAEFLPLTNLGLIVLDECHDDSFKQDNRPIYHCLQMASCLMQTHQAQLVCGSATPRVEDYYYFQQAGYPIYELPQLARPAQRAKVAIVQRAVQQELLNDVIYDAIKQSLQTNHQVLIFHNRRGHFQLVKCGQCTWRATCATCQSQLTLHQDKFRLLCHHCRRSQAPLSACPVCQQAIRYSRAGLKTIATQLTAYLQRANLDVPVWRFDSDNVRSQTLARQLADIQEQPAVLLGSQVISQGLDLPNLQTVIILDADQSLVSLDYRTQEKYYRYIHQLAGRVGRGHLPATQVIIQTQQPHEPVLQFAAQQNWQQFYQEELQRRQKYQLPPFTYFANLVVRAPVALTAKRLAYRLHRQLTSQFPDVQFYQPAPSTKRHSQYLIHVASPKRARLCQLAQAIPDSRCFMNLDPQQLFN